MSNELMDWLRDNQQRPDAGAVILTDNTAVIRALEKRVEELEAENKQLLERESLCDWGWG